MRRGLRFLSRYFFSNPRYTLGYLANCWRSRYAYPAQFLNEAAFREELQRGRSLVRLGDGEINLMLGLRNHYQAFDSRLQQAMFTIVRSYGSHSPYLLAIPRFVAVTNAELRVMGKLNVWMPLKVMFGLYFNRQVSYLDAHSFYYDGFFERTVGSVVGDRLVILVTNQETIAKQRANKALPWRHMVGVVTPNEDALSSIDTIRNRIDDQLGELGETALILFAMGPVGKLLAVEYAERGVQSIDIGKVAEVMYTGESIAYVV